jgi:hypothetical protein
MVGPLKRQTPVVPNASRVRGRLVHIRPDPGGDGSIWELAVAEALDIDDLPNFVAKATGQTISVYVPAGLRAALHEADLIEARVAYRGDQRGGRFALVEDDVRRL